MESKTKISVFGRFDPITGDMLGQTSLPCKHADIMQSDAEALVVELEEKLSNVNEWYLTDLGAVEKKYTLPDFDKVEITADGIEVTRIEDLPSGTVVEIWTPDGDQVLDIIEGFLEISSDIPWVFYINIHAPHFKVKFYEVTAT